jgi:hypothetical protein
MALRDWIGKGNNVAICAIPAISANDDQCHNLKIARIAEIALAKVNDKEDRSSDVNSINALPLNLEQFRFDLIPDAIAAGSSILELERVNNMAWEFMKVDGLPFNEAIRMAAEIVVSCEVSVCEAAYEDVQALWIHLQGE